MSETEAPFDDPIANVMRGWNRNSSGIAMGTSRSGLSAALWTHDGDGLQEVAAQPNAAIHSIALTANRFDAEVWVDGRPIFSGVACAVSSNIVQAGEAPRGVFQGSWRLLHIYMPTALITGLIESEGLASRPAAVELVNPRWGVAPRLSWFGQEIRREIATREPFSQLRLDALGLEFAIALLRFHSTISNSPKLRRSGHGLAGWQIKRASDAMAAKLGQDITLDDLASLVGLSPAHFSRAFKVSTGLPPFAWLQNQRMERAKELLADPRLSLAEVAFSVGFSAQPQFTMAFRRVTGITPGQWRKELS